MLLNHSWVVECLCSWVVFLLRLPQCGCNVCTFCTAGLWTRCMHAFTCVSRVCIVSLSAAGASLFLPLLCHEACRPRPGSSCFIILFLFPKQIIFLRLIKDVSRRLSGICRLPPVLLQFPPLPYVFPFLSIFHVHLQFNRFSFLVQNQEYALWKEINTLSSVQTVCLYSVLSFSFLISVYWFKVCFFSTISWPLTCFLGEVLQCSLFLMSRAKLFETFAAVKVLDKEKELERFSSGDGRRRYGLL